MHTSICAINSAKSLTFAGRWVIGLHCSSEFYFGGSTVLHTFVGSYNHHHQPVRRQAVTRPRLSTLNILLYACGCSLTAAAASVARTYWRGTRDKDDMKKNCSSRRRSPLLTQSSLSLRNHYCQNSSCSSALHKESLLLLAFFWFLLLYSGWHQITKTSSLVLPLMMILMMMTRMHFSHITMVRRRRTPRRCWCCRMCPSGCVFWIWSMNSSGKRSFRANINNYSTPWKRWQKVQFVCDLILWWGPQITTQLIAGPPNTGFIAIC